MPGKFFRILCNRLDVDPIVFANGVEYKTEDYPPGMIEAMSQVKNPVGLPDAGLDPAGFEKHGFAVEFYDVSKAKAVATSSPAETQKG